MGIINKQNIKSNKLKMQKSLSMVQKFNFVPNSGKKDRSPRQSFF